MEVISEKNIDQILKCLGGSEIVSFAVKPAVDGMAGYLGDHFRVTLLIRLEGRVEEIRLFAKTMPINNRARAEFIDKCNYFKREVFMFNLLSELQPDRGNHPWSTKALVNDDNIIVMPDLAADGYYTCSQLEPLDLSHVLLSVAALARYHAAYANYETRQSLLLNKPFRILEEHGDVITEPTFKDTPWVRAAAKLTANFLKTFSTKYNTDTERLELALAELNIQACNSLQEYEDTLNVLVHKDPWINNVMFKYNDGVPINALILDFQLVRYGPPAFDLTIFLYYCTTRSFREAHESKVFNHYFDVFENNLDESTKQRLKRLKYDRHSLLSWCERSRMFGLFEMVGCGPQVLMHPETARAVYDDPATYHKLVNEDRTEPVVGHARECARYRDWLLEIFEEYVERYA